MRAVLIIEDDTLIRELMREHLEREGYVACAVSSVREGLRVTERAPVGLVLLDFTGAAACEVDDLTHLRSRGAVVVMMSTAPRGRAVSIEGAIASVVWSPFDMATLTQAVRRFLPDPPRRAQRPPAGPVPKSSGTFPTTHARTVSARRGGREEIPPLDARAERAAADRRREPATLEDLEALVLDATSTRRR